MSMTDGATAFVVSDGTKSIPDDNMKAVWAFVRETLDRDFWHDKKRKTPNFTVAAEAMKISQPTLSDLYNRKGKGVGIAVLMKLADYAGTTVDAIVGRTAMRHESVKLYPVTKAELYAIQLLAEGVTPGGGEKITADDASRLVANIKGITEYRKEIVKDEKAKQSAKRADKRKRDDEAAAKAKAKAKAEAEAEQKEKDAQDARRPSRAG